MCWFSNSKNLFQVSSNDEQAAPMIPRGTILKNDWMKTMYFIIRHLAAIKIKQ